ncbi:MAG: hypothetical protein J0L66_01270 [Cytophagales bacterium]|nr:hypothetical protein [Cytophagales bacterium]
MTPFEYVSVLISIILGLGITQIVTGIADVIQNWKITRPYLPHALWVVFVFFLHLQEWWVLYDMRTVTTWKLPLFLFTILYPIGLFIMARLLFPVAANQPIVFKEFYYANYPKLFVGAVVLIALSFLDNVVVSGYAIKDQPVHLILVVVLAFLIYKKPRQQWVHLALAGTLLVFLIASMVVRDWVIEA